jgi:anti-sigma B factor antagonist
MEAKPFSAAVRFSPNAPPNTAFVELQGDINISAEAALNAAYVQSEQHNSPLVVLNFTHVNYINSTGIALIVGLLARARKAKRELAVSGLSDHYREIFTITRLSDFMRIYPDDIAVTGGDKR